jgi:hypothetical protein
MFNIRHFARFTAPAAACLLGLTAVTAQAGPFNLVDGTIGLSEYAVGSTDSGDTAVFANSNLDIDRVRFRNEVIDGNSAFFMGFDTIGGSFDLGSPLDATDVQLKLFDSNGNDQALLTVKFEGAAAPNAIVLLDEDYRTIDVLDEDWAISVNNDFEIGILSSYLSDIIPPSGQFEFGFELELSDSGSTQGDQHADILTTDVPEPATLALVGLGAAFMAPRRRRR